MHESSSATVVATASEQRGSMNFWSVSAIGIGSMVGAGIFALLGQAALVAKHEVYLAFILGGIVAMLSGYSYARLAGRYPSAGGINECYRQAFGKGLLAGTLSIIYYLTLLVASAMIAKSFGHYAARSFGVDDHGGFAVNLFSSGIVVLLAFVNMIGSGTVGKMETLMVGIKMIILGLLVAAGVKTLDPSRLQAHDHIGPQSLLASVGLPSSSSSPRRRKPGFCGTRRRAMMRPRPQPRRLMCHEFPQMTDRVARLKNSTPQINS